MIELADALDWLPRQGTDSARLIVYDPPYAVGSPVRGREDGAAGSVFAPLSFLHLTLLTRPRAGLLRRPRLTPCLLGVGRMSWNRQTVVVILGSACFGHAFEGLAQKCRDRHWDGAAGVLSLAWVVLVAALLVTAVCLPE
jgi:hypothetical protein